MKISIITVVWNGKKTIQNAIDSVLNQTYSNIEYIVIDGDSTDGTVSVVQNYGDRISKFISEPDKGIYDGLNKGVLLATGDVIAILHSDDLYANNKVVSKIVDQFNKDCNLDGVYGDLIYTSKDDINNIFRYWKSKDFNVKLLKQGWMPAHPTLFLRREVYDKFGIFDLNFKISADYDFMLRILNAGIKVKYFPGVLYKMRVGGASNKSIKSIFAKSIEDFKVLKKNNIGGLYPLIYKNLSKVVQFISRP